MKLALSAPETAEVIENFCGRCDWVHQVYGTRKFLYDENADRDRLQAPHYQHFFFRIVSVLQESWVLGVVALHDPATQSGHDNLTVDYVLENINWDNETRVYLNKLRDQLRVFASKLRPARNRVIAHGDLATITTAAPLGDFDAREDVRYFEDLCRFANLARKTALGKPFFYDGQVKGDVDFFLTAFDRGRIGGRCHSK